MNKRPELAQFIYANDMGDALSLGMASGENVILHGPGGHAKSEYVEAWFESKGITPFVKFLGEGTETFDLFGGLDLGAMLDDDKQGKKRIEFLVENSWIMHEYVVFEEMLDAPARALMSLKDAITSGFVRNGNQIVPIKTKMIVAITNKKPDEIATMGPSQKALLERFPIQHEVKWPNYNAKSYAKLFSSLGIDEHMNGNAALVCEIIASVKSSGGDPISPRTAVKCFRVLAASASLRGAEKIEPEDFRSLRFIDGLGGTIEELIEAATRRAIEERNKKQIEEVKKGAEAVFNKRAVSMDEVVERIEDYKKWIEEANSFDMVDPYHSERNNLVEEAKKHMENLLNWVKASGKNPINTGS